MEGFEPPLCLHPMQVPYQARRHRGCILATRTGFEPVSSAVTGRRNRPDYANEPYVIGGGYQSRTDEYAVQRRRFPTSLIPRKKFGSAYDYRNALS